MFFKGLFKKKVDITEEITKAKIWLNQADVIVVGIGAGLSATSGIDYIKSYLTKEYFPDYYRMGYKKLDELCTMYSTISDENAKAYWGFWGRYIKSIGYDTEVGNGYKDLLRLIRNREYLIYTTNYDGQVQKTGFKQELITSLRGDCRQLICKQLCCDKLYDSSDLLEAMIKSMKGNLEVSGNKVPRCPHCGGYLVPNLGEYNTENVDKIINSEKMENNTAQISKIINIPLETLSEDFKVVCLELGVGQSGANPIKKRFDQLINQYPNVKLIRMNKEIGEAPKELEDKVIHIAADLEEAIAELASGVVSL